jgi:hypothetical protein
MVTILSLVILLLILAMAGWFIFKSPVKISDPHHKNSLEIKPPRHRQSELVGTVLEYGSNPDGDIDKMLLATSEEKVWLHFPPHTARSVKEAAPVHSHIEATVDQGGPAGNTSVYELKYLRKQSVEVGINLAKIPAPVSRKGFEVEIKGNIAQDLNPEQEPGYAFILSGKLILLPPHMAQELFPLIRRAKMILVKGYMRDSSEGFLSASGKPVVKASAIQLDSITYKIR